MPDSPRELSSRFEAMVLDLDLEARADAPTAPITLRARAVPWGVKVPANAWGDTLEFEAGAITVDTPGHVPFLADHDDHAMGFGVSFEDDGTGLVATVAIPRDELSDPRTATVVRQLSNGVRSAVSVGVRFLDLERMPAQNRTDPDHFIVHRAQLLELSSVIVPRFPTARVTDLAASNHLEDLPMTTTATADQAPTVAVVPSTFDPEDLAARMAAHMAAQPALQPGSPRHPLARFATLREYLEAAREDSGQNPELPSLFALADQITPDNPGVIPPGWLQELQGKVTAVRPTVGLIARQAPATGMEVDWPYHAGDLSTYVGEQLTQKAQVTSVKVSILKGQAALRTFAGGSDISYQLLLRSSPSYLSMYVALMAEAYGLVVNRAAVTALVAAGTGVGAGWTHSTGADGLAEMLFSDSVDVESATGQPADIVLMGTGAYKLAGPASMKLLAPSANTAQGGASAATLDARLAGLRLVHEPGLGNLAYVVTNRRALAWFEDGPRWVAAENVAALGHDAAVWGMGALGAFIPGGILKGTVVNTAAAAKK